MFRRMAILYGCSIWGRTRYWLVCFLKAFFERLEFPQSSLLKRLHHRVRISTPERNVFSIDMLPDSFFYLVHRTPSFPFFALCAACESRLCRRFSHRIACTRIIQPRRTICRVRLREGSSPSVGRPKRATRSNATSGWQLIVIAYPSYRDTTSMDGHTLTGSSTWIIL